MHAQGHELAQDSHPNLRNIFIIVMTISIYIVNYIYSHIVCNNRAAIIRMAIVNELLAARPSGEEEAGAHAH